MLGSEDVTHGRRVSWPARMLLCVPPEQKKCFAGTILAMSMSGKTWQEELAIIDRTMRAISSERDPGKVVELYYDGVGSLVPVQHYMSLSRRGCQFPTYVVTRSSRTEDTDVN